MQKRKKPEFYSQKIAQNVFLISWTLASTTIFDLSWLPTELQPLLLCTTKNIVRFYNIKYHSTTSVLNNLSVLSLTCICAVVKHGRNFIWVPVVWCFSWHWKIEIYLNCFIYQRIGRQSQAHVGMSMNGMMIKSNWYFTDALQTLTITNSFSTTERNQI